MTNVGYARVSSHGQNLIVQLDKLQAKTVLKSIKRKKVQFLPKDQSFEACLDYVREGDTAYDYQTRSSGAFHNRPLSYCQNLRDQKVNLEVIDQNIETHTSTGRLLFNMLGAIAQFETEIRSSRATSRGHLKSQKPWGSFWQSQNNQRSTNS